MTPDKDPRVQGEIQCRREVNGRRCALYIINSWWGAHHVTIQSMKRNFPHFHFQHARATTFKTSRKTSSMQVMLGSHIKWRCSTSVHLNHVDNYSFLNLPEGLTGQPRPLHYTPGDSSTGQAYFSNSSNPKK